MPRVIPLIEALTEADELIEFLQGLQQLKRVVASVDNPEVRLWTVSVIDAKTRECTSRVRKLMDGTMSGRRA